MQLIRGQIFLLPPSNQHVALCLGWEQSAASVLFDLDAGVALFDAENNHIEDVYFDRKLGQNGAVRHFGDNIMGQNRDVGDGNNNNDQEKIALRLAELESNVKTVFFVVCIYSKDVTFSLVRNAYARVVDGDSGTELCRFDLDKTYFRSAVVMGAMKRMGSSWGVQALGIEAHGKTVRHLRDQLTQLLQNQTMWKLSRTYLIDHFGEDAVNSEELRQWSTLSPAADRVLRLPVSPQERDVSILKSPLSSHIMGLPTFRNDMDAWFEFSFNNGLTSPSPVKALRYINRSLPSPSPKKKASVGMLNNSQDSVDVEHDHRARTLLLAGHNKESSVEEMKQHFADQPKLHYHLSWVFFVFSDDIRFSKLPPIEVSAVVGDKVFGTYSLRSRELEKEVVAPAVDVNTIYRVVKVTTGAASSISASSSFIQESRHNASPEKSLLNESKINDKNHVNGSVLSPHSTPPPRNQAHSTEQAAMTLPKSNNTTFSTIQHEHSENAVMSPISLDPLMMSGLSSAASDYQFDNNDVLLYPNNDANTTHHHQCGVLAEEKDESNRTTKKEESLRRQVAMLQIQLDHALRENMKLQQHRVLLSTELASTRTQLWETQEQLAQFIEL